MYQSFWYVQVYTANPTNPKGLQSFAYVINEATIENGGADINNDGDKIDKFSQGGHIINPAHITVSAVNTSGALLAPTDVRVGQLAGSSVPDYSVVHTLDVLPDFFASLMANQNDMAAVMTAMDAAISAVYFTLNSTQTVAAPTIAGYTLQSPTSPHTMTLTNQQNDLTFVYAANGSNTTNAAPSAPNSGGINAQTVLLGNVFLYGIGVLVSIIGLYTAAHIARKH